ncbi:MAG: glycosyltransferase [Paramuribaculum sp.]|nr:glycosyltransferase [Paramuribaculum sp.]
MTTLPLFSIITVTRNAAETLAATIESVESQSFHDFEYIVCDGLSSDRTPEIALNSNLAKSGNLKFFSEQDSGIYDAMNKGLKRASGQYLIFLNAGDVFHNDNTLQIISSSISNNDSPDIVYGQTEIVDNRGKRLAGRHLIAPKELTVKSFSNGMVVCHQAFIPKKAIAPNYDTSYRFSADYKWCIECVERAKNSLLIDEILIDYLFGGVSDKNRLKSLKERFKIMCQFFGTFPTMLRHIGFIPRFIRRTKLENNFS